ncbi:MAG TPA: S41 family peptidase [Sphingomicrobium sp.]|nr:S41 family peptidase [Sphingomicrobium sp.]
MYVAALAVFVGVLAPGHSAAAQEVSAASQPFNVAPWLADLEQARQAFLTKYANLEWLENEHETDLHALFNDLAERMRHASNEGEARAIFDRLVQKTADGHVEIEWPEPPPPVASSAAQAQPVDPCRSLGFDARQNGPGTASAFPGYSPLPESGNPFEAGTASVAGTKIGIIRIGVFQPQGFPELCRAAVAALHIAPDQPCDDRCRNHIIDWTYPRLTAAIEDRARELRRVGATVLLVDITGNGGGSEWAEAVARIVSGKRLVSERRGMVRGEHWAAQWRDLEQQLRGFAATASPQDKEQLLAWAAEADAKLRDAETPCETRAPCQRIADAGFSTGLVASAPSGGFAGKEWGYLIFSPALFPYHDGVWSGPLIVLVDDSTWSAAEEFAAVLQDNQAAVVMGARTGGAGCGHTNGGDPVLLTNSHATLQLPDCVRFRKHGSNEVRGILPDVLVPIRDSDGAHFRALLIAQHLPQAIEQARRLAPMFVAHAAPARRRHLGRR